MQALNIAATGMAAQETNVSVISNNIANMTTTGFKRQRAEFQDLMYEQFRRVGTTSSDADTLVPTGIQIGLGVKTGAVYRILEQGTLEQTGNPLDMAITGDGYFQVTLPNGDTAYSRSGSLQLNDAGEIVTKDGYKIEPTISIPNNAVDITVNESGEVSVKQDGQIAPTVVGQIELAKFVNAAGLEATGDGYFLETPASGAPTVDVARAEGFGKINQGFLESSNVNPVTELTNLIKAQRSYELNSKVIKTTDEMMQTRNQA